MNKTSIFAITISVIFILLYLFFHENQGRILTVSSAGGNDLIISTPQYGEVTEFVIVDTDTGKYVNTIPAYNKSAIGEINPIEFKNEKILFIVRSSKDKLKQGKVYQAQITNYDSLISRLFCIKNGNIINIKSGWFPEPTDVFKQRCGS